MEIQFKKESLFERFELSTSINRVDLLRQFQTNPEMRKELPIFIHTINSEHKIFIEELFTTRLSNDIYSVEKFIQDQENENKIENFTNEIETQTKISYRKKLAALVNLIRRFDEVVSILKISGKIFDELIESTQHYISIKNELNYANINNAEELFYEFCESLWCEIENSIASLVKGHNSKTVNSIFRILGAISNADLRNKFIGAFANSISVLFDSTSSRLTDEQVYSANVNFICGLNVSLFKNQEIYLSFRHYYIELIENINIDNKDSILLISKLIKILKPNDLINLFKCVNNLCFQSIKFENIEVNNYSKISSIANIAKDLLNNIEEQRISIDNDDGIRILYAIFECGKEWYIKYQNLIKNLKSKRNISENMYELCLMIYNEESLKAYRIIYLNLISEELGFETELSLIVQKKERFENVCVEIKNQGKYILYSNIISQIKNEIPTPEEIDNFILKYYALSMLNEEIKKVFIGLKQVVFTPLIMIENVPEIGIHNFVYNGLTPRGDFMKNLFMELPNDWDIDLGGTKLSVYNFLREKLNCSSGSNYGNSKSKSYVIRCDNVVSDRSTSLYGKQINSTSKSSIQKKHDTYIPVQQKEIKKGIITCGVLGVILFIGMIICFSNNALVGGLIFLFSSIALFIGCAKYDYFEENGKAVAALIIITIILCFIFCPMVADNSSDNDVSNISNNYIITLNKDGGMGGTNTVNVDYGDSMPFAIAPTKSGYEFGGYYTAKNGNGIQYYTAYMKSTRTWNKTSNTTLYAKWTKISNYNGGTNNKVDDGIILSKSNFDTYFTISMSGSLSGTSAKISYNISPKNSSYAYNFNSDYSITLKIEVLFYTSQYASYPIKRGYINLTLYKSSGYKKSGNETFYLTYSYDNIYWNHEISYCSGKIYK